MKFIIIITIALVLLIPSVVYGAIPNIPEDYFNTPEKLDWSIVFITSRDNCSSNNQDALKFYTNLTRDYLYKFNFSHESFFAECISKDMMFSVVDKLANYGDLTIVIPDYLMSVEDKHTTGSLGHYGSWIVDTIVSQAETFNIEDRDTAWTLSHELAHFGLNWKGYSHKVMGDAVHEVQKMYNACESYDTTLTNCVYLWDSFNAPSNNGFPVMSPDYVIQVADSMNSNTYSTTIYPTFITLDSINSQVNYGEYEYISGKILNPDTTQGIANKKLIIKAITPSGSTLELKNGVSDKNGRFSTLLQFSESGTWKIMVNFNGDTQYTSTFSDMTSNIIVSNIPQSNNNYGNTDSSSNQYDSDISQRFYESKDRFLNLSTEFLNIPDFTTSNTPILQNQEMQNNLSYFISERHKINAQYETAVQYFEIANEKARQGSYSEALSTLLEMENGLSIIIGDAIANTQYAEKILEEDVRLSLSANDEIDWNEIEEQIRKNDEQRVLDRQLEENEEMKRAISAFKKNSKQIQNFKNSIFETENALKKITVEDKSNNEAIDKAWSLLKISKEYFDELNGYHETGNKDFKNQDYGMASWWYEHGYGCGDCKPSPAQKMGDNLIEISRLIEQSEEVRMNEESKFCFLFWCW
ncbi:MAG: hypothetical protein HOD60_11910 [Candidatus Nitrosopelagicus sp.]|jgi:hypothetical protein|nr:hypothetical protein [Candidatus Nitrosopelagicus sp.]